MFEFGDDLKAIKITSGLINAMAIHIESLQRELDSRNNPQQWDMPTSYPPMDAAATELAITFDDDQPMTTVPGEIVATHLLQGKEFVSKSDFMELYAVIAPLKDLAPRIITFVAGLILNAKDGQFAIPKHEMDKIGEVLDRINEYLNGR